LELFTATCEKWIFQLAHIVENAFYVGTPLELEKCTTDVEIIIKQKFSAVNGNFQEIMFLVTQCIVSEHAKNWQNALMIK